MSLLAGSSLHKSDMDKRRLVNFSALLIGVMAKLSLSFSTWCLFIAAHNAQC